MGNVDSLRPELARGALRQTAQRKFPHGECGGSREALDARGRAGEQDRAVSSRQHVLSGVVRDQKAPERIRGDCSCDLRGIELGNRTADTRAGVVDHDLDRSKRLGRRVKQRPTDSALVASTVNAWAPIAAAGAAVFPHPAPQRPPRRPRREAARQPMR